jgi:thiopurine S-methyltransferase
MIAFDENYWSSRYLKGQTGWDLGLPSPPLYQYLCQIESKDVKVLIPGGGNAYEVAAAVELGIQNVHLLDISRVPLDRFLNQNPEFPKNQIHHQDFFEHHGSYDLILEQTFFCALDPSLRSAYVAKIVQLLKPGGKLVGVLFDREFEGGPPFGGNRKEYFEYFSPYFLIKKLEPCYNSVYTRKGSELFVLLEKSKA